MFNHIMVGTNNLERAKAFYDATFAALGAREGFVNPKGRRGEPAWRDPD